MLSIARALVSQKKRRYQRHGYDLDLCYLHPRVIVMGYPASGLETIYRNPRAHVQRFLRENHGDRFKVYNFCAESGRRYSPAEFNGRVEMFPIEDHNVPTFHQIVLFCSDAASWLNEHPDNIVVLHCKAGKGRAGMMACMLLLHMRFMDSAADAIAWYNRERVHDHRGLTVTSQKKWVHYAECIFSCVPLPLTHPGYMIGELRIYNAPTGIRPPVLRLQVCVLHPVSAKKLVVFETTGHERFLVHTHVQGCVQLEFHRTPATSKGIVKRHVRVWFHTMFATPDPATGVVVFHRSDMDWVARDRKMRRFPAAYDIAMATSPMLEPKS